MVPRHAAAFLAGMAIALAPGGAFAQSTRAVHSQAEALFHRGTELLSSGRHAEALKAFQESQALERGRGKAFLIAVCEEKVGRVLSATRHFEALQLELDPQDERRAIVQERVAALKPRIPHLRIDLQRAEAGATVTLDGATLAADALAGDIPVDPGHHEITSTTAAGVRTRYSVTVSEGATETVRSAPLPATTPSFDPQSSSFRRLGGWVGLGGGAVALGVGAATGFMALRKHDAAESACPSHQGCSAETARDARDGRTLSIVSTTALIVGAAAATAGVYVVFLSGGSSSRTTVGVRALPGGGALGFEGAF